MLYILRGYSYAYYPYTFHYNRPRAFDARPYGYKRGRLDRISMGFIKRADEVPDETLQMDESDRDSLREFMSTLENAKNNLVPIREARGFDSISSGFIRKKRSTDNYVDKGNTDSEKNTDNSEQNIELDKKAFDRLNSGFVKKGLDRMTSGFIKKRPFDRLTSGFVKKDDDNEINDEDHQDLYEKRGLDRLNSGFIKKSDTIENEKRRLDRLNSGFVKKGLDRLSSGFVKKGLDRLSSGFVKKGLDRLSSGFVKKNDLDEHNIDELSDGQEEKRGFDRISSGFVKKDQQEFNDERDSNDKRGLDRISMGFVKKDEIDPEMKRGFDRITSGFVKRPFDRLTSGFVKKSDNFNMEDKRGFDRISSGFVKKSDIDMQDKRGFDRLTSGFVKRRPFDRLSSGFVKKSNNYFDEEYPENSMDKRYFDRLNSGFVKRSGMSEESQSPDFQAYHRRKRTAGFDRIGYGLFKRSYDNIRDSDLYYPYTDQLDDLF
jgi:hypothetical protein